MMRNAGQPENQYPNSYGNNNQGGKKIASHQNQFGNKNQNSASGIPQSSKMSPALTKAMGGSNAKNLPKKSAPSSGLNSAL